MNKDYSVNEADLLEPDLKLDLEAFGIKESEYEEISKTRLEEEISKTLSSIEEGTIISGKVIGKTDTHVLLDVGYKSEGLISLEEFANPDDIHEGDVVEVLLEDKEDRGGNIHLSKKDADTQRAWERTLKACEGDGRVQGKITRKVKGGLMIDIGIEAFLPGSQIALQNIKNMDEFLGDDIEVKVIKINYERRNVVVSRRELLEEERQEQKRDFLEEVKVGDVKTGVVKNITDFGAFIDLHGIDGLLHLTDMKWGRINHPNEMLTMGADIDIMIIGIDYDKERVSLGIKQMYDNPWMDVEDKYPIDSVVKGTVVNLLPYGAFVELEEGVEGLIHISEFSWTRKVNHPSEFVSAGDEIEAMVLSVDPYEQKISLGLRQTRDNPWDTIEERYPIGARIKGEVRNLTNYGAFVKVEDGIDGLIHVSDMSWTRKINHPSEILTKGETVESVILSINPEDRKIALGLKQLTPDPWDHIYEHYREGDVVTGEITNTTSFGAFIKLRDDIEGLIHISELAEGQVGTVNDVVEQGQEITAKIVRIDTNERRIALSIKDYQQDMEKGEEQADRDAHEQQQEERPRKFEAGIDITAAAFGESSDAGADQAEAVAEETPASAEPADESDAEKQAATADEAAEPAAEDAEAEEEK